MKQLLADNEKIIHWPMLKRFGVLLPTFSRNLIDRKPFRFPNQVRSVYAALTGEERPRPMLMWLGLLVALLHIVLAQRLLKPLEPLTLASPLMMEVALMTAAAPQQSETVTKPAPEPQEKPQPPKLKPLKPLKKKPKPILKKPVEVPKDALPLPAKTPVVEQSDEASASEASTAPTPVKAPLSEGGTAPQKAEVFTEANYQANYGFNPKPIYPNIARRQHWEGRVMLRVQVSAEGSSDSVRVQHSSGHEELDEAAVEAVRKWRFIPAKRGDTPVSCSVLVPIIFTLNN